MQVRATQAQNRDSTPCFNKMNTMAKLLTIASTTIVFSRNGPNDYSPSSHLTPQEKKFTDDEEVIVETETYLEENMPLTTKVGRSL